MYFSAQLQSAEAGNEETPQVEETIMKLKRSIWTHVCPAWIAGLRKAHPKFGGDVVLNGIARVEDRLRLIHERFPDDRSSGHVWHEIRFDGLYESHNATGAISTEWLINGITENLFPKWSAVTSPAFGLNGVENGAILNPDLAIVEMATAGNDFGLKLAAILAENGIGCGHYIWWPAFDSHLHRGPLAEMGLDEAWSKLGKFWSDRLGRNDYVVSLEYKPSVPGQLDWIPTMDAAIRFCNMLNSGLDRKAMVINLEWAHALIGGETVAQATRKQIKAGLFGGLVHANSAELAMMAWSVDGTIVREGSPGDDADWAVGEGGQKRWDDQQHAVALLDELGMEITVEHDIDPAGEDPMECYARSRANLEQMIANVRGEPA
jgi:hypothetical protein